MRVKLDPAGRLVIPKEFREALGLSGEVEMYVDGASIRLQAIANGRQPQQAGRFLVVSTSVPLTDDDVSRLRSEDQR